MRSTVARFAQQHPILVYSAARTALFVVVLIALRLLGMGGILLLAMALLVSGMLSFLLLNDVRVGFAAKVTGFFQRMNERIDDAARAEDAEETAEGIGRRSTDQSEPQAETEARQQQPN